MTQVWDDDNRVVPVTVAPGHALPHRAGQDRRARRLQRAPGHLRHQKASQAHQARGRALRQGRRRRRARKLVELRLDDVSGYAVGQELKVDMLAAGDPSTSPP